MVCIVFAAMAMACTQRGVDITAADTTEDSTSGSASSGPNDDGTNGSSTPDEDGTNGHDDTSSTTTSGGRTYCVDWAEVDDEILVDDSLPSPRQDFPWPDECSFFARDCPPDQKCAVWSGKGITACAPIDPDPVGAGEECTQRTCGDDCDADSLCWKGVCVSVCRGTADAPLCDEGFACASVGTPEHSLQDRPLCLPRCDPFENDCGPDSTCTLAGLTPTFVCAPPPADRVDPFEPCRSLRDGWGKLCPSGWHCTDATSACDEPCCTELCDRESNDPCRDPVQSCEPLFDAPELEHVGICM